MAFKYRRRSQADWKRRESGGFEGFVDDQYTTYSPKKGDNYIRILPPSGDFAEDARHYGLDVTIHYGIGPERASILCPARMKGDACPICEAAAKLDKRGDEDGAKELRPNKRLLVWMLDMKDERKGAQLWAMPKSVDEAIVKISKDRSGEIFEVDHPDDGFNISFDKDGEGIGTKYAGFQLDRQPSEVDQRVLDYIEEHDLYKVLRWRDYDEIESLYKGFAGGRGRGGGRDDRDDPPRDDRDDRASRRRRDRDDPPPDDDPPPRRGRDRDDPPPDDDPPQRRGRDRDDPPRDDRDDRASRRRRDRDDPPPDDDPPQRRGRDRDDPPPDDDPPQRRRPRDAVDDDEIPFDEPRTGSDEGARGNDDDTPQPRRRTRTPLNTGNDAGDRPSSDNGDGEGKTRAQLLREKWGNRDRR